MLTSFVIYAIKKNKSYNTYCGSLFYVDASFLFFFLTNVLSHIAILEELDMH